MKTVRAVLAATLVLTTACGTTTSTSSGGCPNNGHVRFGVEPYEDPARLKPAYEVLAKALTRKLGCEVELQIVDDYAAEVLAMRNGKLELAEFGPLGYVFASQKAKAEPLVSFADGTGKLTSYTAGIWVAKDSPVQKIEDLRGKSLALSSVGSASGDALPRYGLKKHGVADVKLDYAGGHPEAMLALINGKVDAAEINSQQLATAKSAGTFDEAKFRQIWKSEPIPNDPITVRGDLDASFKDRVRKALLELETADVEKVGAFLDVTPPGPLVRVDNDTYKVLFDLATTLGLKEEDV
ncbi:phosphate/phosphite/phosphonate ABC transporter substrate-binding protein [Lentzea flava]|uniref:Selenate ABC transporter substrate-binding protein n=1 Tax=Lentzea flava TaxID=103732 RepID=A0ABQ2UNL8_9PSEU|nr:phosphate/phosphite/phosphonate ABC transporter substrate-binding protein [Lentzea flava]MCP2200140.1 phosphonate transport system substrate-binding protein [Lentzea flava]GGU46349.1 putative selenate ABC transporter substrate-binding protein [Lentzea flava]